MGLSHQKECHFENQIEPLNHPNFGDHFLEPKLSQKISQCKTPCLQGHLVSCRNTQERKQREPLPHHNLASAIKMMRFIDGVLQPRDQNLTNQNEIYPLVNFHITMERSTMLLMGKSHELNHHFQ